MGIEQTFFSMIAKLMSISGFTYGTHCNNTDTWTVLIWRKNWKTTFKMLFQDFRLGSRNAVWRW